MKWLDRVLILLIAFCSNGASANCQAQYDLSLDTKMTLGEGEINTQVVNLSGVITLKHLFDDESGVWWAIKGDEMSMAGVEGHLFSRAHEVPFAFHLHNEAGLDSFSFPKGLSEVDKAKLKGLAYFFQTSYEVATNVVERDAFGVYRASYIDGGDGKLLKQKGHYEQRTDGTEGRIQSLSVRYFSHEIDPRACMFAQLKGRETVLFKLFDGSESMETEQMVELTQRNDVRPSDLDILAWPVEDWPVAIADDIAQFDDRGQLSSELLGLITSPQLENMSVTDLVVHLEQLDLVLEEIPALLTSHEISNKAEMRLLVSLGVVDSENVQRALTQILTDEDRADLLRFRAVRALTVGDGPLSSSVEEVLIELISEGVATDDMALASSFILGVGTMIERRGAHHDIEPLLSALLSGLTNASQPTDQISMLNALSNARFDGEIAMLEEYLSSEVEAVQIAAIGTLAQADREDARGQLFEKALRQHDEPITVQVAALNALVGKSLSDKDVEQVVALVNSPADNRVRLASLEAITAQIDEMPHLQETLRSMLEKESCRECFEAIVKALH
ncbi:HEAT repeat domain-containing protein [Ferrimonas pelagia]|uniref:HEAT repeat domain-containing protein n=1 Tax=Ferrimonas pelagia TaxID=1177826 RepID=A0ABP9F5N3_9GAMM